MLRHEAFCVKYEHLREATVFRRSVDRRSVLLKLFGLVSPNSSRGSWRSVVTTVDIETEISVLVPLWPFHVNVSALPRGQPGSLCELHCTLRGGVKKTRKIFCKAVFTSQTPWEGFLDRL